MPWSRFINNVFSNSGLKKKEVGGLTRSYYHFQNIIWSKMGFAFVEANVQVKGSYYLDVTHTSPFFLHFCCSCLHECHLQTSKNDHNLLLYWATVWIKYERGYFLSSPWLRAMISIVWYGMGVADIIQQMCSTQSKKCNKNSFLSFLWSSKTRPLTLLHSRFCLHHSRF